MWEEFINIWSLDTPRIVIHLSTEIAFESIKAILIVITVSAFRYVNLSWPGELTWEVSGHRQLEKLKQISRSMCNKYSSSVHHGQTGHLWINMRGRPQETSFQMAILLDISSKRAIIIRPLPSWQEPYIIVPFGSGQGVILNIVGACRWIHSTRFCISHHLFASPKLSHVRPVSGAREARAPMR